MNFLDDALAVASLERLADAAAWPSAFGEAGGDTGERLSDAPIGGGERLLLQVGPDVARERIWIQCDSWSTPATAAAVAQSIVQAFSGSEPSRYRQLALTRARLAVVGPCAAARARNRAAPLLDGGMLGASGAVLAAMDRFAPALVVHLQDWGADASGVEQALGAGSSGQGAGRLRLVESFYLEPGLHRQLATGARRRWGRPTALARALATHPEARLGQQVHRHVVRMGAPVEAGGSGSARDPAPEGAIRLAPGRYAVRAECSRRQKGPSSTAWVWRRGRQPREQRDGSSSKTRRATRPRGSGVLPAPQSPPRGGPTVLRRRRAAPRAGWEPAWPGA